MDPATGAMKSVGIASGLPNFSALSVIMAITCTGLSATLVNAPLPLTWPSQPLANAKTVRGAVRCALLLRSAHNALGVSISTMGTAWTCAQPSRTTPG